MALTKAQHERMLELEELLEAGDPCGGMEVYLPNLSDSAVWKLAKWSEKIADDAAELSSWLHGIVVEELYRRGNDSPTEAKTPKVPTDWTNSELGAALLAAFSMNHANQHRGLDDFLQQLSMHLAVQSARRLTEENK